MTYLYKPYSTYIFLSDFVVLNTAIVLTYYLLSRDPVFNGYTAIFFTGVNISWLTISLFNKNHGLIRFPLTLKNMVNSFARSVLFQLLFVLCALFFLHWVHISRVLMLISFSIFFVLIIVHRLLLLNFMKEKPVAAATKVKAMVIGHPVIAENLLTILTAHKRYDFKEHDYLGAEALAGMQEDALFRLLSELHPGELFICEKEVNMAFIESLIAFCNQEGIRIRVVFDRLKSRRRRSLNYPGTPITDVNALLLNEKRLALLKRLFDISFAMPVMVLGLPFFVLLYIITKVTSRGPVIYKQERIGKDGRPFFIYKFRSMHVDAEKYGPQLAKDNDPRVTKWGLVMRKTRLDELPQFWNVLKGDMSIVGHRPERRHFIEEISKKAPDYRKLLSAKPGVTSLGQVQYGYAENVDQMCERLNYDLLYARNVNFNLDLNIIIKTVVVMLRGRGK